PGQRYLDVEPKSGPEREQLAQLADRLTADHRLLSDQARALFEHVSQEIANEPAAGKADSVGPVQCLNDGSGDAAAKSRLLLAVLRLSKIHARIVTGVVLSRGPRQTAHHWVEAWLHDRWVPMCPFHHEFGKLPSTYLVFSVGDLALVKGKQVRDLEFGFVMDRLKEGEHLETKVPWPRRFFRAASLYILPPPAHRP